MFYYLTHYNIISIKNKKCLLLQKLVSAILWTTSWSTEFLMLKHQRDASYRQQFDYSVPGKQFKRNQEAKLRKQLEMTNCIVKCYFCVVFNLSDLTCILYWYSWREFNDWHIIGQLIRIWSCFFHLHIGERMAPA